MAVGDTVRAGDVLARLDDEVELNDLRSARAALVAAESSQRKADARLERHKHLYERGITSRAIWTPPSWPPRPPVHRSRPPQRR